MKVSYSSESNRVHSPSDSHLHQWYVDAKFAGILHMELQPGDGTSYEFVATSHAGDWMLTRLHAVPALRIVMASILEEFPDQNPHTIAIMRDMLGRLQFGGNSGTHYSWRHNRKLT